MTGPLCPFLTGRVQTSCCSKAPLTLWWRRPSPPEMDCHRGNKRYKHFQKAQFLTVFYYFEFISKSLMHFTPRLFSSIFLVSSQKYTRRIRGEKLQIPNSLFCQQNRSTGPSPLYVFQMGFFHQSQYCCLMFEEQRCQGSASLASKCPFLPSEHLKAPDQF